ncbi:MAG: hypothetical protein AB1564_09560 [Chloroflexota bacterium]
MAGKYTPLEHYLRGLPHEQREVILSFAQIERILNEKLPQSAYQYREWWNNERQPHQPEKLAMANAGWRVDTVNLAEKWVRCIRLVQCNYAA